MRDLAEVKIKIEVENNEDMCVNESMWVTISERNITRFDPDKYSTWAANQMIEKMRKRIFNRKNRKKLFLDLKYQIMDNLQELQLAFTYKEMMEAKKKEKKKK